MKTERRHQLQTNWLADHIGNLMSRIEPYSKAIAGVVVCAVLLVAAYLYLSQQTGAKQAQGWDQYFAALTAVEANEPGAMETVENVANQFNDTEPGWWARLRLAEIQFMTGVETSFQDRASANDSLRQSVENYEEVLEVAESDMLLSSATFGLARAQESLGELDAAREQYRRLLDTWPDSAYNVEAKRRLEDLERVATKEFYDWFATLDPKPSMVPDPTRGDSLGLPGEGASNGEFELNFDTFDQGGSESATHDAPETTAADGSEPPTTESTGEQPTDEEATDSSAAKPTEGDETSPDEPATDEAPSESGDDSPSP